MEHRLFVRNNVQESRSVQELDLAFERGCLDDLTEEKFALVLKQIRQELLKYHDDAARTLRNRVCTIQLVNCAKKRDLAEVFALVGGLLDVDCRVAVELLTLALVGAEDSSREMEICTVLMSCSSFGPLSQAAALFVTSFVAGDGWVAAKHEITVKDECVSILMNHLKSVARTKINEMFRKVYRGARREI
jgi:hypothetical protein